jgi:putative copper export protein
MTWLNLAQLIWLSASLCLFGLALFPLYARTSPKRGRSLMPHVAIVALIAGLFAVVLHVAAIGSSLAQIAVTGIGRTWLTQLVIIALAYFASYRRPTATIALAGANLIGFALVGHANAIAGGYGVFLEAAHVLAIGAWLGGAGALACALAGPDAERAVTRFSWAATVFVSVIAVTGVAILRTNTGAMLPISVTRYGQLILVKLVLFAAALGCAAFNRLFATPRGAWRLMARVIAGELALLFLIVAAAVALAQTEPCG